MQVDKCTPAGKGIFTIKSNRRGESRENDLRRVAVPEIRRQLRLNSPHMFPSQKTKKRPEISIDAQDWGLVIQFAVYSFQLVWKKELISDAPIISKRRKENKQNLSKE
ncbi:hypothetical protein CEXT_144961 [Caerostris extrusa]|uniref:Uncharacterized protein n=1 Tax=Caerostris extrusa TaxID=172846 RepID=A0AAV4RB08_CAEEX|nr:hypothetical protein CEXT_144961 [Caerostris extrusa]